MVEDNSDGTWDDSDWDSGDTSYDGSSGTAVGAVALAVFLLRRRAA